MPVVEYMLHRIPEGKITPPFIQNGGHWWNPNDLTLVGWVESNPDYYIPETLVYLNREQFAQRALSMHATHPYRKKSPDSDPERDMPGGNEIIMTDEEVIEIANIWYDNYLLENSGN